MPQEEDDDFEVVVEGLAQGDKKTPAAPKSEPAAKKFPSRLVAEAESFGFTPEEIQEYESAQDLRDAVRHEQLKVARQQEQRVGRAEGGGGRSAAAEVATVEPGKPAAPAAAKAEEEDWKFEDDLEAEGYDPKLLKEIKRLGKLVIKAEKKGDDEKVKALEAKIAGLEGYIQKVETRNNPLVKRANAMFAKFPNLFGDNFDEDGRPPANSAEAFRYQSTLDYLLKPIDDSGKTRYTGNPEKDIAAAVKFLFGVELPGEEPAAPKKAPASPGSPATVDRLAVWRGGTQATPTQRNGAERSGVPGGDQGAAKVVNGYLKAKGLPTDDALGDDSDDDI